MDAELDRLQERIRVLEHANHGLREHGQALANELRDLQLVATRLSTTEGSQALYLQILRTALTILRADFATIQMYYPERGSHGELRLLEHYGLTPQAAERWRWVSWTAKTTCGEALRTGRRVAVRDIRDCDFMAGSDLQGYLDFGIIGAQTTPLTARAGDLVGMISTYWRWPHDFSDSELQALDVLARLAADLIDRSRAEERLREGEERLRFAHEIAGIGAFDWNIETGLNTWTSELEAIYGLSPGAFTGTREAWEALVHPDDLPRTLQQIAESMETGGPMEGEWRVVWPDGTVHWVAGRWRVLKNKAGKPLRLMGVNIDVTQRKRMEEALRRSEERLRLAVKATNDAIWDIDMKAGVVSWNDTYSTLYGRPDTGDSTEWWINRIHPEDREQTVADLRAAVAGTASSWSAEYRFRRLEGGWADVYDRAYIARDESGNAWRVIGAMQDLTDRKRAETAVRESEARFRKMADAAPVMIWVSGQDKRCTFFNRGWLEFTGRTYEQGLGNGWAEAVHPEDQNRWIVTYTSSFDERRSFQVEYRLRRADGEYRCVLDTGVPMFTSGGDFEGYIGSCIDITDLKRAQEENLHRQKLESVGVLAAGIAHDFNNLLGGILIQAQVVEDEMPARPPIVDELRKIKNLALRGSEIVRELMVYAGRETTRVEPLDLSALVEDMLELLKISISKRAVLTIRLAKNLPAVKAQASQIRQILMNLITNASEAIGESDGVITVTTSLAPVNTPSGSADAVEPPERDRVRLEVSDTGCGMTQEEITKIFDPFYTTKFAGRGLGLSVVQGIVRAHWGTVALQSAPGRGTTFQILFPCADQPAEPRADREAGEPADHPLVTRRTVLLVEDEDTLRAAVAKMLRRRGFVVIEAADGSCAIDALCDSNNQIDVILLDMTIPGADSAEVVEQARKIRPATRIVITSAYSQDARSRFADVPQVAGYIRKPFLANHLADLLVKAAQR